MPFEASDLQLTDEVLGLQAELNETRLRLDQAEFRLSQAVQKHKEQVGLYEETQLNLFEVSRERDALLRVQEEFFHLDQEMRRIHETWTWRLGRLVLLPVRLLRRLKRILIKN